MSRDARVPMEELLAHREWVARLAHQMAGAGADDVVQETWFAALRSPPQPGRLTRPWLATVLHNAIRLRFRDQSRRSRREQAFQALAPDHVEGVDWAYERVELQRFLAEQVMALEEPLRAIVVLRYVEGLDASEIAERVGAPAGTVRWRLKTALDRLRAAMDGRCGGDRHVWLALLVPDLTGKAATGGTTSNLATKGVLAMAQSKLKVSLLALFVLAVLALSGTLLWRAGGGSQGGAGIAASARSPAGRGATAALGDRPGADPASAARTAGSIEGMVQDQGGKAVPGAIVMATATPEGPAPGWSPTPAAAPVQAITSSDGRFRITGLTAGGYSLTAAKPQVGVARPQPAMLGSGETLRGLVLTLGKAEAGLTGRVVDSGGGAIADARVVAGIMKGNTPIAFAAATDSEGRYALPLPAGEYRFQAEASGYAPARFSLQLHLPMVRDFRLHPASGIRGRVLGKADGVPLPGAEVSLVDLQTVDMRMVTRTTLADDAGAFSFSSLDPSSYRLIAHAGVFVGQHPAPVAVGLAQEVVVDIRLDRGRRLQGTVQGRDGAPLRDVAVMVPFGPVEFLASRQPGVRGRSDGQGRFQLDGLAPAQLEVLATAPAGRARQRIDLTTADREGLVLTIAPDGVVMGTVTDGNHRPIAGARVAASTGAPRGPWSTAVLSDDSGRFRIEGLTPGALSVAAIHTSGVAELSPGNLEPGVPRVLDVILADGGFVSGTVRRPDGRPVAGSQVFAFAGGWVQSPWGQPTSATESGADGSYRVGPLPAGELMVRVASPGDDPFAGLNSRHARPDRVALVLRTGERKRGVDLVVLDNDLTITGRVLDSDRQPVGGAVLNALPDGVGAAVPQGRTLSQADGQFVIEGLSAGPHTIAITHPDHPPARREHIAAGTTGLQLRMDRAGALAGTVTGPDGRPATDFVIVGRPTLAPDAGEHERRTSWRHPPLQVRVMSQPDGAFSFSSVPPGTYELDAYLPDRSVASVPPVQLAAGERRTGLRLIARPSATIRGRAIDFRTGRPVIGVRVQGRGTASGQLTAPGDADGRFSLTGLPAGKTVELAIAVEGGDYITDCQHRDTPAAGGTVDIGDIPLFPGPAQKLTIAGAAATGLWFHSFEGRPTVYSVMPGSPAAAVGARPGELVVAVDGTDVRGLSSSVAEGLVATAGRTVELRVQAPSGSRLLTVPRPEPGTN